MEWKTTTGRRSADHRLVGQTGCKTAAGGLYAKRRRSAVQQQVLDKTAEALAALVEWHAANRAAAIAQAQQQQLNALLEQVDKRQQAGDLGSIDAELTFVPVTAAYQLPSRSRDTESRNPGS